jgi:hypothetical protein
MIRIRIELIETVPAQLWERLHDNPVDGQYGYVSTKRERTTLFLEQNLPDEQFSLWKMRAILSALNDPMNAVTVNGPATSASSLPADFRPTEHG